MTQDTENKLIAAIARMEIKQAIMMKDQDTIKADLAKLRAQANRWRGGLAVVLALGGFAISGLIAWLKS